MRLTRDLEISISEGTKNITVSAHGGSVKEVVELITFALQESKQFDLS